MRAHKDAAGAGFLKILPTACWSFTLGLFACVLLVAVDATGTAQAAQGEQQYPITSKYDVPDPANPYGKIITCDDVRVNNGKTIFGGEGGLKGGGQICHGGGGQNFCVDMVTTSYTCAGVNILDEADIEWRDFDIDEEEDEETQRKYYGITTRDETRGRAGHDLALFMNAHGVCRKIDNTSAETNPLFMGVSTAEEWRTVHGVPEGGDPNGGYTLYANTPEVKATMTVCCAPVVLEICGAAVTTGYAEVGQSASVWGGSGHGTVQCVGNNDWRTVGATGICGGGGGGGSDPSDPSGGGYYNPNNGGEMTADQWDKLDKSVQDTLKEQGYAETGGSMTKDLPNGDKQIVQSPEDVKVTNDQAVADAEAAQKAKEEEDRRKQEELERLAEEARLAAEEAERQAQEEAENDDDDDDCVGVTC